MTERTEGVERDREREKQSSRTEGMNGRREKGERGENRRESDSGGVGGVQHSGLKRGQIKLLCGIHVVVKELKD